MALILCAVGNNDKGVRNRALADVLGKTKSVH